MMGKFFSLIFYALSLLACGCAGGVDYFHLAKGALEAGKAATVSEKDLVQSGLQLRAQMDSTSQTAPEDSHYTKRLKKVMANEKDVNGVPLNYKVYMNPELNANATPDGSIRVNSGLMDAMNDDELRFVLGHEMGHIAQGHSLNALRVAYGTAAARTSAAAFNPYAAMASDSFIGDLAQDFLNSQYSQSQELDADSYGVKYLRDNHYNVDAASSAMRKLGNSGGGFFDTHPSNEQRLQNIESLKRGADPKTLTAGN